MFTGVHANYLVTSIRASGFCPDNLTHNDKNSLSFAGGGAKAKAKNEIWG